MKVESIMVEKPAACSPETNLAEAAALMWEHNCGALPIVDGEEHVVGVITDRDICMAVGTRNKLASEIRAGEVMSGNVYACTTSNTLEDALSNMREHRVRRIPVVDNDGHLRGIISTSDIVRNTAARKRTGHDVIAAADAIETLKQIEGGGAIATTNGNAEAAPKMQPAGGDFDFEE